MKNQADAASGDVSTKKAARSLWRAAGLRPLSIRPSGRGLTCRAAE